METFFVKIVSACKSMLFQETCKTGFIGFGGKQREKMGLNY